MIRTYNVNTNEYWSITEKELRDKIWGIWCWDWMEFAEKNPWASIEDFDAFKWTMFSLEYEVLQRENTKTILKNILSWLGIWGLLLNR